MFISKGLAILGVILLVVGNVSALQVIPPSMDIQGQKGDFKLATVTLYNNDNRTINVNISVINYNQYFLPKSRITMQPFARYDVLIGFTINNTRTAIITYEYGNNMEYQMINLIAEKVLPEVQIYPLKPKGGDTLFIIVQSGDELVDATGMLFCNNNVHIFPVNDGIGIVKLNNTDKGTALLRIIGSNIQPIIHSINISATASSDEQYKIIVQSSVSLGRTEYLQVKRGNTGVKANVNIREPDGAEYTEYTDDNGRLAIHFDKIGKWIFEVNAGGQKATASTTVSKAKININVETDNPEVGRGIYFTAPDDATIQVTGPDNYRENVILSNGEGLFTPHTAGTYKITATNDTATGVTTVIVKDKPKIYLYDNVKNKYFMAEGGIYNIGKQSVRIDLMDSNNNYIGGSLSGIIRDDRGGIININFIDGMANWYPQESGTYTITVNSQGYYKSAMATVKVSAGGGGIPSDVYVALGGLIAIAIMLYYRDKIRGIVRKYLKKEEESEEMELE